MASRERIKNRANVNKPNRQKRGNPSDEGKQKAQIKDAKPEKTDRHEEMRRKYMESGDNPTEKVKVKNPNRNTNKPDIDKPAY